MEITQKEYQALNSLQRLSKKLNDTQDEIEAICLDILERDGQCDYVFDSVHNEVDWLNTFEEIGVTIKTEEQSHEI